MDELENYMKYMILKYVKEKNPNVNEFEKYIAEIYYGSKEGNLNYLLRYQNEKMIITKYERDYFTLTNFGEYTLKHFQRKNRKEWAQTWVSTGALIITTITLIVSTIIGFL